MSTDRRHFIHPRMGAIEAWFVVETEFNENSDIHEVISAALEKFPGAEPEYISDILGILFRWDPGKESLSQQDIEIECALYDELESMHVDKEDWTVLEKEITSAILMEELPLEQLELFH